MAAVFSVLGIIIIIGLLLIIFFIIRRYRRAKRAQHNITGAEATRESAVSYNGGIGVSTPRAEPWSTTGEAPLSSFSSLYSPTTVSPTWDSESQTSLLPTTPQSAHPPDAVYIHTQITRYPSPPPAYCDLSRRTTSTEVREYGTR